MIAKRIFMLTALLFSLISSSAFAAGDASANAIFPFLDDGTSLVLRVDVDKVDVKQVESFINDTTTLMAAELKAPAEAQQKMKQDTEKVIQTATNWFSGMTDAGAKSVYGLLLNANFLAQKTDDPAFVIPDAGGIDTGRVGPLMKQAVGGSSELQNVGDGLVFARKPILQIVKAHVDGGVPATSIDPADLAAAFSGEGDAPIRIAYLPGEKTRAWIEQNLPALPPFVGGGETAIVSRGVKWASLTITQKPEVLANVTIRCTDANAAKALQGVLDNGLAFLRGLAAQNPGAAKAQELAAIQPALKDDTITFSVKPTTVMLGMTGLRLQVRNEVQVPPPGGAGNPDGL